MKLFWCIITVCTSTTDCTQFKGQVPANAVSTAIRVNLPKKKQVYAHCGTKEEVEKFEVKK